MVAIKNVLLFVAAASALPAQKRTVTEILSDISTIDSDVNSLTSSINSYTGGLLAALPIQSAESTLDTAIKQGTTDADATSPATDAETTEVLSAVQALIPDIEAALNALVAQKTALQSAGAGTLVSNDLTSLKTDTDAFASALIAIASASGQAEGTSLKATIDTDFTNAINSFA